MAIYYVHMKYGKNQCLLARETKMYWFFNLDRPDLKHIVYKIHKKTLNGQSIINGVIQERFSAIYVTRKN
jgi:hypothetical protein